MIEDTCGIQMSSLVRFMSILGYEYFPDNNHKFVGHYYKDKMVVSFTTAVKWHNLDGLHMFHRFTAETASHHYGLPTTDFIYAFESRLVERVKLQKSKAGEITVQSHIVKYLK